MTGPFNEKEVLSKATELSRKYRSYAHKDDLIQEACLSYYEAVANGETDPSRCITHMRKAMNRYANLKDRPVALPVSDSNYRLMKDLTQDQYDSLTASQKRFYDTIKGNNADPDTIDDVYGESHLGAEEALTLKQSFAALNENEQKVVLGCTIYGLTQEELADSLKLTRQRIGQLLAQATSKLQKALE